MRCAGENSGSLLTGDGVFRSKSAVPIAVDDTQSIRCQHCGVVCIRKGADGCALFSEDFVDALAVIGLQQCHSHLGEGLPGAVVRADGLGQTVVPVIDAGVRDQAVGESLCDIIRSPGIHFLAVFDVPEFFEVCCCIGLGCLLNACVEKDLPVRSGNAARNVNKVPFPVCKESVPGMVCRLQCIRIVRFTGVVDAWNVLCPAHLLELTGKRMAVARVALFVVSGHRHGAVCGVLRHPVVDEPGLFIGICLVPNDLIGQFSCLF